MKVVINRSVGSRFSMSPTGFNRLVELKGRIGDEIKDRLSNLISFIISREMTKILSKWLKSLGWRLPLMTQN